MNLSDNPWNALSANLPRGEALRAKVAFPEKTENLLIAVDADGKRHLLIPLSEGEEELNDTKSRGVRVESKKLQVRGKGPGEGLSKYIDILCQDNAGFGAFDVIGRELADALATPGQKSDKVRNALARWRRFWGQVPAALLTREEIIGLFAELRFLSMWLMPFVSPKEAMARWRGPDGARHDFEWKGRSVEVKGTTSHRGRIHLIHGVEQLERPERGDLLFFSVLLREEGGASYTLPKIIAECRAGFAVDEESLEKFESALGRLGYSPAHDEEYLKLRFRVADEALYGVKDSFPRITAATFREGVPAGVEAVKYEINLAGHDALIISRAPDKKWVNLGT